MRSFCASVGRTASVLTALVGAAVTGLIVQSFVGGAHAGLGPLQMLERTVRPSERMLFIDSLSPIYRQSSHETCGAAAMAFALTLSGDLVVESQLLDIVGKPLQTGLSFAELRHMARSRGLNAEGVETSLDVLENRGAYPALAHLKAGHFVTITLVHDDLVYFFDPAMGQTVHLNKEDFKSLWSGKLLWFVGDESRP